MALLEIENLTIEFDRDPRPARVVEGVSLKLGAGETVALVGESGSGKSVTALSIARLVASKAVRYPGGAIWLKGRDVLKMPPRELQRIRGGVVSYIFQEPSASLNPVIRVGKQIKEVLQLHQPKAATDYEVIRLLKLAGIPAPESRRLDYPHQMSGGMQQRVMIAMALASRPKLLVADEPTTALDVTIQAQILTLLSSLKQRLQMGILLITHNLGIVGEIADRVAVMYGGQLVETGPVATVLAHPKHPYTRALIRSVPRLGATGTRLATIGGQPPSPEAIPDGCRFHPRCSIARSDCRTAMPSLVEIRSGQWVRCPYWMEETK